MNFINFDYVQDKHIMQNHELACGFSLLFLALYILSKTTRTR